MEPDELEPTPIPEQSAEDRINVSRMVDQIKASVYSLLDQEVTDATPAEYSKLVADSLAKALPSIAPQSVLALEPSHREDSKPASRGVPKHLKVYSVTQFFFNGKPNVRRWSGISWRKAKRLMREYNTSLDGMLTIEMVFQPIKPLQYIAINLKVEPQ